VGEEGLYVHDIVIFCRNSRNPPWARFPSNSASNPATFTPACLASSSQRAKACSIDCFQNPKSGRQRQQKGNGIDYVRRLFFLFVSSYLSMLQPHFVENTTNYNVAVKIRALCSSKQFLLQDFSLIMLHLQLSTVFSLQSLKKNTDTPCARWFACKKTYQVGYILRDDASIIFILN
jgi:hypothetical protein